MKTKKTTNKRTYYIIVDQSGSMADCIPATLSTVNEQLDTIKSLAKKFPEQEVLTGITFFNTEMDQLYFCDPVEKLHRVSTEDYSPNGMTALLDTVGQTILALNGKVEREIKNNEASVVVIIITDGYENSSKHFNHGKIKSMIGELESTKLWSFSYYGADMNDISDATKMGIRRENSAMLRKSAMQEFSLELSEKMEQYVMSKSL